MRRLWVAVALAAAAVVAVTSACSGGVATGPPDINYGRDVCDQCHMIISEARYASAYRTASGEPFVFDDVGDMLAHLQDAGMPAGVTVWVHDFDSGDWVEAADAWFVHSQATQTPMGGGTIAYARERDARAAAAADDGTVLRWGEMVDQIDLYANGSGHRSPGDAEDGMAGGGERGHEEAPGKPWQDLKQER